MARRADICCMITEEAGSVVALLPMQFDFPMSLARDAIDRGGRYRDTGAARR